MERALPTVADGRFALVVATSQYSDDTLTQLQAPAYDAESLALVLGEPTIGNFEISTLVDQPAVAAMQVIEAFFDGRSRDDLLLLYFSGHGILDQGARLYFATTDTRVDRPRSTAIPAAFVNDLMSECRSRRQVLVLDCCNSGSFARGVKAGGNIGTRERFEGRGRVVITASDALQYAFEAGEIEREGVRSVFTEQLVEGLKTGAADLDGDGYVALDELYDYVYGRVVDASPRQRPGKWAFGVEGKIFIARTIAPNAQQGPPLAELPEIPAPSTLAPTTRQAPLTPTGHRRLLILAVSLVAVAAAIAAAVALLASGSPSRGSSTFPAERNLTLTVFHAWLNNKLDTLTGKQISRGARAALTQMPVRPITPNPPQLNDCEGQPANVTCVYTYPGLNFNLDFNVFNYSSGHRLVSVICRSNETSKPIAGGIAACARRVRNA